MTILFGWRPEHDEAAREVAAGLPPELGVELDEELRCLALHPEGHGPQVVNAAFRALAERPGVFLATPTSEEAVLRHLPDAERLRPPNWAAYLDEHEDGVVWRASCETCSWSLEATTEPALEQAMAAHDRRVHAPAG